MTFKELVKTVFLLEIFKGMALTLRTMFRRPVTIQYPTQKKPVMPGFRGLHALTRDPPQTGDARCVGCGLCAAICPSRCIHIYTADSEEHKKIVERYEIDVLRCLFCGLCVEACPYAAVVLTEHYEYSGYTREEFYMTKEKLLKNYDLYMGAEKSMAYFSKFWHPLRGDFGTPKKQVVFKGRKEE